MNKGYWIVRVDVVDPETYKKYIAANAAAFRKYGGRFLVRGGKFEVLSGTARARNVVIEFKDSTPRSPATARPNISMPSPSAPTPPRSMSW